MNFGTTPVPVSGRVTALALDPSDANGNHLYVGTTGGGVWLAQNAGTANAAQVTFTPLTDTLEAMQGAKDASISIGALTVQPGGTGVILAGTGDPNDELDSYYGAGILRSPDGGKTWSLIQTTQDAEQGLSGQDFSFVGEGFAGFAWSTVTPNLVVAGVSQAYEGLLVDADRAGLSYEGLYYSPDGGVTWFLATITDLNGTDVQGPLDAFDGPDGNAVTSVVWNPIRKLFFAAVRLHGYYQSVDGIHWTQMASQPGSGLTAKNCPTNPYGTGSAGCPIFRGALAVNPETGDTFAWTVGSYNSVNGTWPNEGIWQDKCAINTQGNACTNLTVSFAELPRFPGTDTTEPTVADGGYTLALAAVPAGVGPGYDTLLFAGADDLWKCSLAMGCPWRNTTNATTGFCGQVGAYQHALAWNAANPLEMFDGNDSGLWRSTDQVGETGAACGLAGNTDAAHFDNLNGSLGSLAEVESLSPAAGTPTTIMAGLGVNGTAGVKSTAATTAAWPQVLGGNGGPVAIDPTNGSNWYVNNQDGVSIYLCAQVGACTPADFGTSPVVDMNGPYQDGYTMTTPAPFLVDPLDPTQLLVGTCRVWRVPAAGGWTAADAESQIFDSGVTGTVCNGDVPVRSMAAMKLSSGSELVVVGTYGAAEGGFSPFGQVWSATITPGTSGMPVWTNLSANPVTNDGGARLNENGNDISSVFIDPHSSAGLTIYVTIEAIPNLLENTPSRLIYGSWDGGASWQRLTTNLPQAPVSSVVVDPQDENTVYVATDAGVWFTTAITDCQTKACWAVFGTGLPGAPVTTLSADAARRMLTAGTYGRGVWQTPLWTASTGLTTAAANPDTLAFGSEMFGVASGAQAVTLTNTGSLSLTPGTIVTSGDFGETDNCQNQTIPIGGNCTIQVTFTPAATGSRDGQLTIPANVYGGQLTVALSGTGTPAGTMSLTPSTLNFGLVEIATTSAPQPVTAGNSSASALPISAISVTSPFTIAGGTCAVGTLAPITDCLVQVAFAPTVRGAVAGTLTFTDAAGTQTVQLNGTGASAPTDSLPATALTFPATVTGQFSTAQTIPLSNIGDLPLTGISISVSGPFQESDNCGSQLVANSSCAINVTFAPTSSGPQTGTLTVTDALKVQTVTLSGTGLQPPALGVLPASLNFPVQLPGVASAPLTLTILNTGGAAAANVGFQITGPAAASFTTGATTCGATLASGSSCGVQVTFDPVTTGGSAATLTVSSSSFGVAAVNVPLSGSAQVLQGLGVNPAQLTFAALNPGQSSAVQTVTLTNTSGYPALGLTLTVGSPFSLTQNTCASSLAAGANCTVGVVFSPLSSAAAAGTLTVTSTSVATAATVALVGSGGIQVSPATISFPETGAGTTSSPATLTVTNLGAANALTGLALTPPAGFLLVSNTCAATLPVLGSCTVGVEFAPGAAGQQTGSLTVTTSTVQATPVALSGMGFDFTVAASGTTSLTVASGQTANYSLVMTPLNGSQGTFAFAVNTLPENTLFLANPTTSTVSAGTTGNVTVEIMTGQGKTARSSDPFAWGSAPLACGLAVLPFAWRRRRKAWLALALLVMLAGGVSSCTSSGGGTGGSGGLGGAGSTPAGTYSIPVTVTSTGVSHSFTVTMTVD